MYLYLLSDWKWLDRTVASERGRGYGEGKNDFNRQENERRNYKSEREKKKLLLDSSRKLEVYIIMNNIIPFRLSHNQIDFTISFLSTKACMSVCMCFIFGIILTLLFNKIYNANE